MYLIMIEIIYSSVKTISQKSYYANNMNGYQNERDVLSRNMRDIALETENNEDI